MDLSGRTERKKEETRVKIIQIAMGLFKEQGLGATTMEEIAARADIAKGTLYHYFPVKEAIIDEYIKRAFKSLNAERVARLRPLPDTRTRMVMIINELVNGVQAQKEIFEKYILYRTQQLLSFHVDESQKSGLYLVIAKILDLGQASGEIRTDLPRLVIEDQFEFIFMEVVKQAYLTPEGFDQQAMVERCVDLFLNGVKKTN